MKIEIDSSAELGVVGYDSLLKGRFEGRSVAVKRVPLDQINKDKEEAMLQLDHLNVDKILYHEKDNNFRYYAFEQRDVSLHQLFLKSNDAKKYKGPMPHHVDALLQLATGLEHIHSKNFIHGDIKPENVLISVGSGAKDEITLKWANFGLTRNVSEQGRGKTNQVGGNNAWLAPELQLTRKRKRDVEENNYKETAKSDVYAQGLVFGSLFLNGEHLYGSMGNDNEIPDNIITRNPINMQKIDGKLRDCYENDLLKKMLELDPNKRMTSTQVVNQLKAINDKIAGKEKELLELCGRDSRSDLREKIKNLIQFGINLNAKDGGGRNALHLLCRNYSSPNLTDAIKLLIENKIDVNAKDADGLNAFHYLCRYHSSQNLIKAIQLLIQFGIHAKATTNDGSNALHYLCRYNASPNLTDATKILTKLGLDLMAEDNDGWSAFYYLQSKDKKEMKIWFDRDSLLGQGGFGTVFKGKFGGREVAVKRVELRHVNKREEEAMLKLEHPNIVKLLHCEKDNDFMYYALELCVASLDQLFLESDNPKKYNGPMPRQIKVFSQLAKGLEHIHSKNIIHRDIKPHNIFIMQRPGKNEEIIIKWSDFGLAKSVNEKGLHSWSGVRGTRTWYAPEVLEKLINGEKAENEEFWGTVKSDVFVLGLVFGYLFLKGEHLYGSSEKEIHDNIIGENPVNMQDIDDKLLELYKDNLLSKMLEHNPSKRISSEDVVKQLNSIKEMLTRKENELLMLCEANWSPALIEKIENLIRMGINVNAKDHYEQNALHSLCRCNSGPNLINAIRVLIKHKIDVNAKDGFKQNALHHLCRYNSSSNFIEAIQLLIEHQIDVNAKNRFEQNAFYYLCQNKSGPNLIEGFKLLIEHKIDVNARDGYQQNALHHLCRYYSGPNLTEAIRLLIKHKIDVNAMNRFQQNALYYLDRYNSSSNFKNAIQLLIKKGISSETDGYDARPILVVRNAYNTVFLTKHSLECQFATFASSFSSFRCTSSAISFKSIKELGYDN
ncbi:hypothetical protein GHT06_000621 [Daphnia sinensis]|uniref:non-specific serine/threonine protein kinase n=1 Tax=Daphnia sinensis TaxID=1820382 RepID=A0AAD5KUH2_9CRUS|nr:hypothetical protein GHT06_000621 [Daphnia sinensis]